jgi:2-oxoglutarate dehydrogenase E2 component (dihydrolipoamide succinyltransferase)
MANFEIIMPKLGESIEEATITNWFVKEGDKVEEDDVLLEIATDKVDSEIPSPVDGFVKKVLFKKDEVVPVGTVIAIIDLDGDSSQEESEAPQEKPEVAAAVSETIEENRIPTLVSSGDRFYSPLVRKIASEEGISQEELDSIAGSGLNGRVQKDDVMRYLDSRDPGKPAEPQAETVSPEPQKTASAPVSANQGDEVIEMSRLRKLIAGHMVKSKQVSAHVTNMIEVDVTNVVNWRNQVKE